MEWFGLAPMRKVLALMLVLAVGFVLGTLSTEGLHAQPQSIKRAVLVKAEKLTGIQGMDGYVMDVTIAPGAQSGWHVHPGHEFTYVLDGEGMLERAGEPPMPLKKGVGFHNDVMVPHNGINTSKTAPLHLAIVYIVQSGKPVATPVPAPAK
jgi:quercetin dioxygenase-like cupin family protein